MKGYHIVIKGVSSFLIILFISLLTGCSSTGEVTIIPRDKWNAEQPKPFKVHVPVRITIHHEGEIFKEGENSGEHIHKVQKWGMSEARNWADIPYHFLIDPKGNIFEGRNVFTAGETATEYNPEGHLLITLLGNFEEQTVTEEQLNALIKLTAYCCEKYDIDPETIASHKDFAETLCPGKDLYKYIENGYIKSEVKKLVK